MIFRFKPLEPYDFCYTEPKVTHLTLISSATPDKEFVLTTFYCKKSMTGDTSPCQIIVYGTWHLILQSHSIRGRWMRGCWVPPVWSSIVSCGRPSGVTKASPHRRTYQIVRCLLPCCLTTITLKSNMLYRWKFHKNKEDIVNDVVRLYFEGRVRGFILYLWS